MLQRHEDACGRCRLEKLWARHGDPAMKAEVERIYSHIRQRRVERHLAGRVN